jgi:hypothetical protein
MMLARRRRSACWSGSPSRHAFRVLWQNPIRCRRGTITGPRKAIVDFVARTTATGGADFVPVPRRIAPSVLTMTEGFEQFVGEAAAKATLETIVVEGAMDALRKGDADRHNALIATRAPEFAHCDAIMLAHFSTSRALAAVVAAVGTPVLTAPDAAVDRIRAAIGG